MTEIKNMINCGQIKVQRLGRLAVWKILTANGIKEGDTVEVYLKKVN